MEIPRFSLISPLDHRYYFANEQLFNKLQSYLSEEAAVRYCIAVELSFLETVTAHLSFPSEQLREAKEQVRKITSRDVFEEEEKTKHNLRAIVNVIKRRIPKTLASYVHLGITSSDVIDTAWVMRVRDVSVGVILPELIDLQKCLLCLGEEHLHVTQVGRTHGQYAVPITMGHMFAEYISRVGGCLQEIIRRIEALCGKLSGAVGTYNALALITEDPMAIEKEHLSKLGLRISEHSTQINAPEPTLRLLLEYNTTFGVIANLADDLRNLQRSEIGEVYESFSEGQVGSSTMPHKRNPWNNEHVKSLYKTFVPRVLTMFLDQISEHQRDLTNSASTRFVCEYLAGFSAAIARMKAVLTDLRVDIRNVEHNLSDAGDAVLAEALYVLLVLDSEEEGYEMVKKIASEARDTRQSLAEKLRENRSMWEKLDGAFRRRGKKSEKDTLEKFLQSPSRYVGCSIHKSEKIIEHHKRLLSKIESWKPSKGNEIP